MSTHLISPGYFSRLPCFPACFYIFLHIWCFIFFLFVPCVLCLLERSGPVRRYYGGDPAIGAPLNFYPVEFEDYSPGVEIIQLGCEKNRLCNFCGRYYPKVFTQFNFYPVKSIFISPGSKDYLTGACPVAPVDGTGALPAKFFENDSVADLSAGIVAGLIVAIFCRYINEL
jgi:hypothetical protein